MRKKYETVARPRKPEQAQTRATGRGGQRQATPATNLTGYILHLQRTAGNAAVTQLLKEHTASMRAAEPLGGRRLPASPPISEVPVGQQAAGQGHAAMPPIQRLTVHDLFDTIEVRDPNDWTNRYKLEELLKSNGITFDRHTHNALDELIGEDRTYFSTPELVDALKAKTKSVRSEAGEDLTSKTIGKAKDLRKGVLHAGSALKEDALLKLTGKPSSLRHETSGDEDQQSLILAEQGYGPRADEAPLSVKSEKGTFSKGLGGAAKSLVANFIRGGAAYKKARKVAKLKKQTPKDDTEKRRIVNSVKGGFTSQAVKELTAGSAKQAISKGLIPVTAGLSIPATEAISFGVGKVVDKAAPLVEKAVSELRKKLKTPDKLTEDDWIEAFSEYLGGEEEDREWMEKLLMATISDPKKAHAFVELAEAAPAKAAKLMMAILKGSKEKTKALKMLGKALATLDS